MADIEIKKNGLDQYQVWRGREVLRPKNLTWEPEYQSDHDFMYYNSLKKAEKDIELVLKKEEEVVIKIYEIKEK